MSAEKLFKCFMDDQIKYNTDRFQLRLSTEDSNQIQTGNSLIKGILYEKFLGIRFDNNLGFDQNVKSFCENAETKVKALASFVPCIVSVKKNLVMNFFFTAQFNHCLLIWLIHSRFSNNQAKYLSTLKMYSIEFLLTNKNKKS